MAESNEREPQADNVINMDGYLERKSSRAKRRRAEARTNTENRRHRLAKDRAEADAETESMEIPVDEHGEAYRARVAFLDKHHISVKLSDDDASSVLENIGIGRLIDTTTEYLETIFCTNVVVGADGFPVEERPLKDLGEGESVEERPTATAYLMVHAAMVGAEEDFQDLADQIDRAILADRALERSGAPVPFAALPDLVRTFPGIGRAIRRSREEATYELYGGAGHVCKMDDLDLDELRIQLVEQVLAYVEPFNDALEAQKGTKDGVPRYRLLQDLCSDGMVAQAPVTQDGSRYRTLTKHATKNALTKREQRLRSRLERLRATGMDLGKGFAVGWNMEAISMPEMHLILWVNLMAAGIPQKWWEQVDFTDDGTAKGKTERDGILEFLEFMTQHFPEHIPARLWTDKSGSVEAFQKELHDRYGCQVVSPPTKTQLASHLKEALPEVDVEVPDDAKYDELKRLADEYQIRYSASLKPGSETGPMRPLRPYGRLICPGCGVVPQMIESVEPYPDATWRSEHGLPAGMSAEPLYAGKGQPNRYRFAFKCKECKDRYRVSYVSDPLQWGSVPHVAERVDIRNAELGSKQSHDLLSAVRDVMAGQAYSRRESINFTMRKHGFGNKGAARRQWGATYEVQMLLVLLVAICSNARQLVHATCVYQQVLAEEMASRGTDQAA